MPKQNLPGQSYNQTMQSALRGFNPVRQIEEPRALRLHEMGITTKHQVYIGLGDGRYKEFALTGAVTATTTTKPGPVYGPHVLATTAGLGADHTTSGLTAGQVLRSTGATTAAFQNLVATDLPSHVIATTAGLGSQHSVSGLTAGQYLRATGATTAAFQTIPASDLPAHDLLGTIHGDTAAAAVQADDIIFGVDSGGGVIKWTRKGIGGGYNLLGRNGAGHLDYVFANPAGIAATIDGASFAKGDILYAPTANPGLAALPIGTTAYPLTVVAGLPAYAQLTTAGIADLAVTTGKIATIAVTIPKLAMGTVPRIIRGDNMLQDGAFEVDQDGDGIPDWWQYTANAAATRTLNGTDSVAGGKCLQIARSDTSVIDQYALFNMVPGYPTLLPINRVLTYNWAIWTKRTNGILAGNSCQLILIEYDLTPAYLSAIVLGTITPGTSWAQTTGTVGSGTFNAATKYVQFLLRDNSTNTGATNRYDAVLFYI